MSLSYLINCVVTRCLHSRNKKKSRIGHPHVSIRVEDDTIQLIDQEEKDDDDDDDDYEETEKRGKKKKGKGGQLSHSCTCTCRWGIRVLLSNQFVEFFLLFKSFLLIYFHMSFVFEKIFTLKIS